MNIEIKITADNVEELQAALTQLGKKQPPPVNITCTPTVVPEIKAGELEIPAGTDMKVAEVTRDGVKLVSDLTQEPMKAPEPEKPKRKRTSKLAAELAAETPQIAPSKPVAVEEAATPTEPEKPAEKPVEAAETKWETVADSPAAEAFAANNAEPVPTLDEIAAAGARLLDADAGKMMPLLDLLKKHSVQAITQLKPEQLGPFAAELRELGAEI